METIESKAANTILQQPVEINVGTRTYHVAPPSVATLILVSEAVSRLPQEELNEENVMEESLSIAKDCRVLGDLAATLILGAKHINDVEKRQEKRRKSHLWGLYHTSHTIEVRETAKERLSRELLEELTPRELHNTIAQILLKMQVGDFFRAYHFPDKDQSATPEESGNRSDSIWATVAGTVKAFNLPIDYVLYEMSYANLTLYGASLPSYKSPADKDGKKKHEIIDAGDRQNRDKVRAFLDSID